MLDLLRPFVPLVLVVGTLVALGGLAITARELWRRIRITRADIAPRDWEREAQRGGDHDGRR